MTVAPRMPMATYRLSRLSRGTSPVNISATAGLAQKISMQKQPAMTVIRDSTKASMVRMPKL